MSSSSNVGENDDAVQHDEQMTTEVDTNIQPHSDSSSAPSPHSHMNALTNIDAASILKHIEDSGDFDNATSTALNNILQQVTLILAHASKHYS